MFRPVGRQYEYPPQQYSQHPPSNGPPQQQQYNQSSMLYTNTNQQQQQQNQQQQQQQQSQQQQQYHPPGQQGQGQGQNPQPNGGGGSTTDAQSQANSGPGGGQEMNLASVLHYLQSEWRRWERDRNEWEIERAEMRARIALLEGQRRSAENLKVDLLRRVKMLEYALRQERTKTVSTAGKSTVPPSRLSTLQDEDKTMKDEKEGSGSEHGSDEGSQDRLKVNGIHPAAMSRANTVASRTIESPWKSISAVPKDPKARARSREYLKQCLQEITYLTSPGALNPLPPRPPLNLDQPDPLSPATDGQSESAEEAKLKLDRPRKTLPENPPPSTFNKDTTATSSSSTTEADKPSLPNGDQNITSTTSKDPPTTVFTKSTDPAPSQTPDPSSSTTTADPPKNLDTSGTIRVDTAPTSQPPSSPAAQTVSLPEDPSEREEEKQLLTAIYRPESKTAWREELRAANAQAEKARERSRSASVSSVDSSSSSAAEKGDRLPSDEEQLQSLTLNVEEESTEKGEDMVAEKTWTSRKTLKSHLDVVRAVAFAHGPGLMLASAGDDCTVKVWYMPAATVLSPKPNSSEIEPIITYRSHTAPITSLAISSPLSTIFSASLDSSILAWRLPSPTQDAYGPYDPSSLLQTLEGHTDAVWDLCLVPSRYIPEHSDNTGSKRLKPKPEVQKSLLVSASADGTVKVWEHGQMQRSWLLKRSIGFEEGLTPTCLGAYAVEAGKALVGFGDGRVGLVDVEQGGEVGWFGEAKEGGSRQVNAVLCHPTWPVVIVGYEDGYIRLFNAKAPGSQPTAQILAHPSALTSLTLSPLHPHSLISSAADCSIRVWDLDKRTSIQDCPGHRQRAGEGVVGLARHPELPVMASAGADGVVRVWSAT